MVNELPKSWRYTEQLEMLFLFYQYADELLSETTSDTYSLPVHNTLSLTFEIEYIYELLQKYNLIKDYYSKYIPVIIDELLESIENDSIIKSELGDRRSSILTGFCESKTNHILLQRWLSLFQQSCSHMRYISLYQDQIVKLVKETKNKNELYRCTKVFFTSLVNGNLSREFLFNSVKRYFNNDKITISQVDQIESFFAILDQPLKEIRFLILMDVDTIEYLGKQSDKLKLGKSLNKVIVENERSEIEKDPKGAQLLQAYDKQLRLEREYQSISLIRYITKTPDPFLAIENLDESLAYLQSFTRYYKHYYPTKQIFKILKQNDDGSYSDFQLPNKLRKRPYIDQEVINSRVSCIFKSTELSQVAFNTISGAFQMHSQALDSKNEISMLRNFWISLETLFSNPVEKELRDNAIQSTLSIIQKTYILKLLRTLYHQLVDAIGLDSLSTLGIGEFLLFIKFFSENKEDSENMKKVYGFLSHNPLLRSRIYDLRKKLGSGKKIAQLLISHHRRIEWQLERIYRARNIATHIGDELPNTRQLVDNLHAYFDYIVNYIICKIEMNDYISNISALVFESKNDNLIHIELLKSDEELNGMNYIKFLFGPDCKIVNYAFEY